MQQESHKILSLDPGSESIGSALIDINNNEIIYIGARISRRSESTNRDRRSARSTRRNISRRKMRRDNLLKILTFYGMLPSEKSEREILYQSSNPYELRAKSLDQMISLEEIGRVFVHINKRRGFQSNRKNLFCEEDKDETKTGKVVTDLESKINRTNSRTLGEFLFKQPKKRSVFTPSREMYKDEFNIIWDSQTQYYNTLTDTLKDKIYNVIFFQRPLKSQKHFINDCRLESDKKCCPNSRPEAQRFRMLQEINNLRVYNPMTGEDLPLLQSEKKKLTDYLEFKSSMNWNQVRKVLGYEQERTFNLEGKGLTGNSTLASVYKTIPEFWVSLNSVQQGRFLEDIFSIVREEILSKRLIGYWNISEDKTNILIDRRKKFELGRSKHSLKAFKKLLPHLERGESLYAAERRVGYKKNDIKSLECLEILPSPNTNRNSIVYSQLCQLQKVVNAVIREYGKPDEIHLEVARDSFPESSKEKKDREGNEKRKKQAKEALKDMNLSPTYDNIIKWKLWEDQKGVCIYSGQSLGMEKLFSTDVEVDHILPYSRTLDDSYSNKVVCLTRENRDKGDKTPREKWGNDERYDQIRQRASQLDSKKKKRIETTESIDLDKSISRHLNDTRYICNEAKAYLEKLGVKVQTSTGYLTAKFRQAWGLDSILSTENMKNRDDHRHHAIDAVIVALMNKLLLKNFAKGQKESPWEDFYYDVRDSIENITVSHQTGRKISRPFHVANPTRHSKDPSTKTHCKLGNNYYLRKNNHHIEIIQSTKTGKWEGETISVMEAANRARRKKSPIVQRDHGPVYKFIMSLAKNETVRLDINGTSELYRIQKISGDNVCLKSLNDATTTVGINKSTKQLKEMKCVKVGIDPLGKVRLIGG